VHALVTRITQVKFSDAVVFFKDDFLKKYDLEDYADKSQPSLFYGCYTDEDVEALRKHEGPKVMLWRGSDAMDKRRLLAVKRIDLCYHVANSIFTSKDLARRGIPHVQLPVTPVDYSTLGFVPCKKGNAIYVYTSLGRPAFYGEKVCDKLRAEFRDIEFIICHANSHSREALLKIYERCFLGLRLVKHDGLPNTVIELSLMGRRTVHNGELPGSLPYAKLKDIRAHITRERETIGTIDAGLHAATLEYLQLPSDWLDLGFYETRCRVPERSLFRRWRSLRD